MTEDLQALHHNAIWTAIDELAVQAGVTLTGLCHFANIHESTLRPCKRKLGDALRWPSTGTISNILIATGTSWLEFGLLVEQIMNAQLAQHETQTHEQ